MPARSHLVQVARELRRRLNGKAFFTLDRVDVTQMLRDISGEDTTRIKSGLAGEIELALLEQGVRCYPGLVGTTTGDTIRIFHAGSVLGSLVDLLAHPSKDTDHDLGAMLKKIKGQWDWSTPATDAAAAADAAL
ncbi:MAG: hypothetical protein LC808_20205 [Actinobacteria bacterium]|nr:hypothetical protein [Actinomycetota bacterium]